MWVDEKYNGKGTLISADGTKFVGDFKDGENDGQGEETLVTGEVYTGEFDNA